MVAALLITVIFAFLFWLVFFKLKLIKFSIAWGIFGAFFFVHLLLVFLIGVRFVTPYSTDVTVIQHTIQLVPRLPEPTLVTGVLVKPNVPIKKGQPLFQFDRRPYEYKVRQLEAALAEARQNVLVLKADLDVTEDTVAKAKSELEFARIQHRRYHDLAEQGAGSEQESQRWTTQMQVAEASVSEALANAERARLRYRSEIGGVNTNVARVQAELDQALYYLENTTMVAPEDGFITNLQVQPGMVSGIIRFGAIASFVVDAGRYVLGAFYQEHLKFVEKGQPVEVALALYPGRIFKGTVHSIWRASGQGQLLPSGELPTFNPPAEVPQGRFAVQIVLDGEDQAKFPIGARGAAAIYTGGGGFAALRRIVIRTYTWLNWLYPIPF